MSYYKHISSEHKLMDLKLKEVWKYRDLIVLFTKRNFQVRYKQTILGPMWLFVTPIISSLIYCFIFGGIAGIKTGGVPQLLFYMISNSLWTFFSNAVNRNAATFTSNAHVFGKVYFPRLTIPIANILTAVIEFGIQMILIALLLGYYYFLGAVKLNWSCLLLAPLALLQIGILGMGTGILVSSVTTKYRDLSILVGFAVQLWMYLTPVVYPLSEVPGEWMRTVVVMNPVTAPFELFRYSLLGEGCLSLTTLTWSGCVTVFIVICGIIIFNKVERTFMDTV